MKTLFDFDYFVSPKYAHKKPYGLACPKGKTKL